jgi:monoamine oxidase
MNLTNEVSIVGGGLSGLVAAIDLLNRNFGDISTLLNPE